MIIFGKKNRSSNWLTICLYPKLFRGIHSLFFFLFSIRVLPPILCLLKALFNEIPKCVPEVNQFTGNCGPYSFQKHLFCIQDIPANAPRLPLCPHDLLCGLKKHCGRTAGKGEATCSANDTYQQAVVTQFVSLRLTLCRDVRSWLTLAALNIDEDLEYLYKLGTKLEVSKVQNTSERNRLCEPGPGFSKLG